MQEQVYSLIVENDDISWKSILLDLITTEQMDPWNVDVSLLTKQYIAKLKELKNQDLKLSGKVLLAAAILLRIKSKRLVGEDLNEFDRLLAATEEAMSDDSIVAIDGEMGAVALENGAEAGEQNVLLPHTPLPRKRKVSVYDLVNALEKALEVKHRRLLKQTVPEVLIPTGEGHFDTTLMMKRLFLRIKEFFLFKRGKALTLDTMFTSQEPLYKIREFLAVLHLATMQKIRLSQKEHFGAIEIKINPNAPMDEAQKTLG